MTRHQTSSSLESDSLRLLRPLQPSRNLTEEVVDRIAQEIRSGRMAPGAKLPTEMELMTAMGVSRTVVREAVAALRAEGLVVTRQGLGAFVTIDASRVAFRIATVGKTGANPVADVLNVMELRLAVEVEAAALAATRASPDQLARIDAALTAIEGAIARGDTAVAEDFAFHRAIADATANSHFADFLDFLGRHVIPRQTIRAAEDTAKDRLAYLTRIQRDHVRVAQAIRGGDPAEARRAMRAHLSKSLERYRRLTHDAAAPAAVR